ncbi:MAG TPA: tetratricopeptide repeat protein [Polyangia bacterium]
MSFVNTIVGRAALAAALLAGAAAPAWAQKNKHGEAEVSAVQTARTKPQTPGKAKAQVEQPRIDTNEYVRGVQTKMAKINDVLIGKLQRLIRITEDDARGTDGDLEKPGLLFRVAELYAEKQRYYAYMAGTMDEKIAAARTPSQKDSFRGQKAAWEQQERQWLLEAVKTYLEVANNPKFKKYKKMDEVLFYLAYMLQQVKREEQARVFFQRLIKDHPQSKFIPDAYMSFGVYYFQQGDMDAARKIFDRVTQFPDSRVYGYAMYLKAWCWYNMAQYKRSLETFEQVIELAARGKKDKLGGTLERDAKINMVLPYSRIEPLELGAERAWNYFKRYGGTMAPRMHERLAEVYWEQGKYKLSNQTYHQLMRNFPTSQSLCKWQYNIVRNTISAGGKRDQVQELQRLAALYEHAKDKKILKPDKMEECEQDTQQTLYELATVWHKEAQKTQNHETYALAQYLYKEYIHRFPKAKEVAMMTYYLGDLLFILAQNSGDAKQWQEAAETFTKAVQFDLQGKIKVKTRDGMKMMRNEAAFAAVFCWMRALKVSEEVDAGEEKKATAKKEPHKKAAKKGKAVEEEESLKPIPIPPKQQKILAAFDTYLQYVPQAPERIRIHYQKCRIYYEANQFDKSAPCFAQLVTEQKTDPLAVVAANLLLNSLEHQKKFSEIADWVHKFLVMPELTKDAEFKAVLEKIKLGIEWKKVEELEARKQYKEAALGYIELANAHPDDERYPKVLYNAAINFERVKLVGNAMRARKALIEWSDERVRTKKAAKPDPLAQKALFQLGQSYMELTYFQDAAEYFERFAAKFGAEKEAPQALSTAVFFRRGLGQDTRAIEDSHNFVKYYGQGGKHAKKEDAAAVEFSIGNIYESQKNWDRLVAHYQAYLKKWGGQGGTDREILAHVKIGEVQWRNSCPVAGVNGACIEVKRVLAGGKASLQKHKKGKKAKKGAALRTQCGPDTKSKITVHPRKPAMAKAAQEHFATALRLFAGGKARVPGKDPTDKAIREAEMTYAVAQAKFMQTEASYEKFLLIQVPTGLEFSADEKKKKKNDESIKKFKKWIEDKSKFLEATSAQLQSVITLKQAHWAIAALARIGQLYQNFADQLYTVEIPKAPKVPGLTGESYDDFVQQFVDTYCDQMSDQAEPLDRKATEGFTKCLAKSTELFWYNEWSAMCEQELYQLKPRDYPMAVEIRAQPGKVEPKLDEPRAVLEVKE